MCLFSVTKQTERCRVLANAFSHRYEPCLNTHAYLAHYIRLTQNGTEMELWTGQVSYRGYIIYHIWVKSSRIIRFVPSQLNKRDLPY